MGKGNHLGVWGDVETYHDVLPDGWAVISDECGERYVILQRANGAYSTADRIDTAKVNSIPNMPRINLDKDFVLYIVDKREYESIDEARERVREWDGEKYDRMLEEVKKVNEGIERLRNKQFGLNCR